MRSEPTILLCAGEMSGDLHAAHLVRHLKERLRGARILAFAGDRCADAGAELLFHYRDYAVLGFTDVIANLSRFRRLERALKSTLTGGVDLFIPVDYPGLNLRLASHANKRGVPVLYYISPQVWAWGSGRIKKISRSVNRMAVILPFEVDLYRRHGIPVEFVGHPFVVDHELPAPLPEADRAGIGLLPGSRVQEVQRILPVLLATAVRLKLTNPDMEFTIGRSPAVPDSLYRSIVGAAAGGLAVGSDADAVSLMRRSRLLLVASGTATLQGALMETPIVIVYKTSPLNYFLGRRLVKIPNIGLVNVILGETVCPEFIQGDAGPEAIGQAALGLLNDAGARARTIDRFRELRSMLSGGGGCTRVADIAAEILEAA